MDRTSKKSRFSSFPAIGRRSFFKIGAAAYASLMYGCGSRERGMRAGSSRSKLLKGEREWVSSICTLCPSACAIRAYSEAGKIVAIGGDPDDPNTGGKLCPIGLSMLNLHNNPDRLGDAFIKKPDGKMALAKPEEILALVADRIRRGGSLHLYGRITPYASYLSKTLKASCHLYPLSEGMSADPGFLNTDGRPPILNFENARIALLFDANILEHGYPHVGYVRRIAEARMRGLQLVTLSPFLTNTATAGDWIPLRSREAVSLAPLAMVRRVLDDTDVRISNLPQEVANSIRSLDETLFEKSLGLSGEAIQAITMRFFLEPGPAISALPDPAVLLLNIMKGNLDKPWGLLHPGPQSLRVKANYGDIVPLLRDSGNVVFLHQSNPAFSLSTEILPILRSPDRATLVCVDSFMSETAELSDFVLPLASPLETLTLAEPLPLGLPFIAATLPAVAPHRSCQSFDDWLMHLAATINGSVPLHTPQRFTTEIVFGNASRQLPADRAIYQKAFDPKPLEAQMPAIISALRSRIALIQKQQAPNGPLKSDQCFLTTFEESIQGPVAAPSKWLDEISYSPKIYLHPQRARHLGIQSGDRITLKGDNGASAEGIALLFEGVHPDALAIPMHHGHTGYGRVARGERFSDPEDPDMSRIFWGKNLGINPADFNGQIVTIGKKRG
jgi:anaerobic selenocysteine-containing dehydrogenase